ncbi:hypothetical protein [Streptomyces zagrosensis]|uniref:Uncharacterized protein n=1 Tax=Streptomyces zagrosensis TaxID=1042984 RepID=A0A7W9V3C6_9ACTN|nr:hypothetical protein [Streptomyces zagrosensis]MBB5939749.1 hypothetical protein [Streptomyces zagrosensis]
MSVLAVPRLYFNGVMSNNPATGNNNDQWPVYDFPHAELNWDYLNEQQSGITPENVRDTFPVWARQLRDYVDERGRKWQQCAGEWNYYGDMGWALHHRDLETRVTGTQLAHGTGPVTDDELVKQKAVIDVVGDPFPGNTFHTPARAIDNNPDAFWCTNFYLKKIQIGTVTAPECFVTGEVQPGTYMTSRWLNLQRNLNTDGMRQLAGVGAAMLQACLPKEELRITQGSSVALQALKDKVDNDSTVRGLMVRCVVYLTHYFNLDGFEDCNKIPDLGNRFTAQYSRLVRLWNDELEAGRVPSQNPTVSKVVGTVGLWHQGEDVTSGPCGRVLYPKKKFFGWAPPPSKHEDPVSGWLGSAMVECHKAADGKRYAVIDLGSTIPETDGDALKAQLSKKRQNDAEHGALELVLSTGGDKLPAIPYGQYAKAAYERTSGIVELLIPDAVTDKMFNDADLSLKAAAMPVGDSGDVLTERATVVETDQRSTYLDGDNVTITLHARTKGAKPTEPTTVRVAQYMPDPYPPGESTGGWHLVTLGRALSDYPPAVTFEGGDATSMEVTLTDGTGSFQINRIDDEQPGCPILVFFPGETKVEDLPEEIGPVPSTEGGLSTASASFCCVRVLPRDKPVPTEFRTAVNACTTDSAREHVAWKFLYDRVLYVYDVVYPVMRYVAGLDLGDKTSVDKNIAQIVELADPELRSTDNSTLYMPSSRELSEGKYQVMKLYQWLVENGWKKLPGQSL